MEKIDNTFLEQLDALVPQVTAHLDAMDERKVAPGCELLDIGGELRVGWRVGDNDRQGVYLMEGGLFSLSDHPREWLVESHALVVLSDDQQHEIIDALEALLVC
jgi:hypothetical protein